VRLLNSCFSLLGADDDEYSDEDIPAASQPTEISVSYLINVPNCLKHEDKVKRLPCIIREWFEIFDVKVLFLTLIDMF
jgi:hypothetical protein